jgi:hypothetical protein
MTSAVPKTIVKEVGMLAELGATQVVRKSMADVDLVAELCDYPGAGWTMFHLDEEVLTVDRISHGFFLFLCKYIRNLKNISRS